MADTIEDRLRAVRAAEDAGDPELLDRARIAYLEVDDSGPLGALASSATDPVEKAHYLLRVAAAHADGGTGQDFALARKVYDDVIKLGAKAGESAIQAARSALKSLPR